MAKWYLVFLSIFCLLFMACSKTSDDGQAYIRYQNMMSGTYKDIHYGVRMGDAVFEGSLPSPSVSGYYSTDEGSYSVQWKNSAGTWITVSAGALSVKADKHYTLGMTGDTDSSNLHFAIVLDY